MIRWSQCRHAIGMLVLLWITTSQARGQVLANTESNGANGLCVACWVQNPGNASDTGAFTTFSTMKLTVGVLGAYVYQRLHFATAAPANRNLYIVMESTTGVLLDATVLGGLQITSYIGGVSNSDTKSASGITIHLLAGSSTKYILTVPETKAFDEAYIRLNAGVASALTSMRVYSAYYMSSSLPVTLTSFSAYRDGTSVRLMWTTASEINNDHFSVERSTDGIEFTTISAIPGAGNTNMETDYYYMDIHPLSDTSYYRLRQTDYDGRFEVSAIVSVAPASMQAVNAYLINNPVQDKKSVSYYTAVAGMAKLELYDMSGRQMIKLNEECQTGLNKFQFQDQIAVPAGHYAVRLKQEGMEQVSGLVDLE